MDPSSGARVSGEIQRLFAEAPSEEDKEKATTTQTEVEVTRSQSSFNVDGVWVGNGGGMTWETTGTALEIIWKACLENDGKCMTMVQNIEKPWKTNVKSMKFHGLNPFGADIQPSKELPDL